MSGDCGCERSLMESLAVLNCHPEPLFWVKDLPEHFRLNCNILALLPDAGVLAEEPRERIYVSISREILRPASGLRMTG